MLVFAYPEMQEADMAELAVNETAKLPIFEINKPITINFSPITLNENSADVKIMVTFDRGLFFAGDEVKYNAKAILTNSSNIAGIALIFDNKKFDYSGFSTAQVFQEIIKARPFGQTIELIPDSTPPFSTKGTIPFPAEQDVFVQGFIFKNNDGYERLEIKDSVFKIYPISSKLELEANRALLTQVEEQRKSTLTQEVSNHRLLGLTWIGIGIIPILVCADTLLRIYLRESVIEKWFVSDKKSDDKSWDLPYY